MSMSVEQVILAGLEGATLQSVAGTIIRDSVSDIASGSVATESQTLVATQKWLTEVSWTAWPKIKGTSSVADERRHQLPTSQRS